MKISGTGSALPKRIVSNDELSTFLDTSDEWIFTRTGVKTRHVISDERLEDLAIEAANKALEDAGLKAEDLDFIICSNVVNEFVTPQLSCIIQGGIGATCPCIDINCACAGFVYALDLAESYYRAGKVKNVLVVCAEEPTRMADWNDRRTCVLFGDGAGAAVLTPGDNIKDVALTARCDVDKLWQYDILHPTPFITKEEKEAPLQMKGQDVFKFAVRTSSSDISNILQKNGLSADEIDHYLLHQANLRIINTIADFLDQSMDKFPVNIENHGNSSSASCPILLDQYKKTGKLKRGDKIIMSAFGAGLVSGVMLFEW